MASQQQRQQVLDYINANPQCTTADVCAAMGADHDKTGEVMKEMWESGDLGRQRMGLKYHYTARATEAQPSQPKIDTGHDKYMVASDIRQMVLDYANKEGRITGKQITQNLMWKGRFLKLDHAVRTCNRMAVDGELLKHGKSSGIFFTPLKTKTMSAIELRDRQGNRKRDSNNTPPETENVTRITRRGLIHNGMSRTRPLPYQGGQGSGRQKVCVGSTAEWI
jgi:hypothetical protein